MHLSGHKLHSVFVKNANALDAGQHNFLKLLVSIRLKCHSRHALQTALHSETESDEPFNNIRCGHSKKIFSGQLNFKISKHFSGHKTMQTCFKKCH